MQSTTSTVALAATLFAAVGFAQQTQTGFFNLTVTPSDGTVLSPNVLAACHVGADVEQLCLFESDFSEFRFNYTQGDAVPAGLEYPAGALTFAPSLDLSQALQFKSGMVNSNFFNVEYAGFGISTGSVPISFRATDHAMAYVVEDSDGSATEYYDWLLCPYAFESGSGSATYNTLTFNFGKAPPRSDCTPVTVFNNFF